MSGDGVMAVQLKKAPYSLESEQSVLGSIVVDQTTYHAVAAIVGKDDFFIEGHRVLFGILQQMAKASRPIDLVTVLNYLKDVQEPEATIGREALASVSDCPSTANVVAYAERVRECARRRRMIAFAHELASQAYNTDSDEMVGSITTSVSSLLATTGESSMRFWDACSAAERAIKQAQERRTAGGSIGAPTGLASLDRLTGGFSGPRLILMAARPKCGKSALLNQFGVHAARNGYPGLIISLELGAEELAIRAMANVSQVNVTKLHRGYAEEMEQASERTALVGDIPLWFDTTTTKLDAILAQISLHKYKHGITWAAVDHIGLVRTSGRFQNRNEQLGHISWSLKELARGLKIPVILLSQLSRQCDKDNRRPRPDDLRDSGNIEQDADMVIMLHTQVAKRDEQIKPVQIGVPANRIGPSLWLDTLFEFEGRTQTFRETSAKAEPPETELPPLDDSYRRNPYRDD